MPSADSPSPDPLLADTQVHDRLTGRDAGEYRILGQIGAGGMGVVYEAVQPIIGRRVAIKFIRAGTGISPAALIEEARAANTVRHRGIIDVFAFGVMPEVGPYLVMDLLEGESLAAKLGREGPIEVSKALYLLENLLPALEAAHLAGVVHRDIKPSNVFLVKEGRGHYPKLLDFGLAQRRLVESKERGPNLIVGTPEYVSPEQARGEPATPRSDLYSVGVMAFEMLTGRLPFTGNNPAEVLIKQIVEPAPPPSRWVALPAVVDELIAEALAKDPARRPRSAAVMLADVRSAERELQSSQTRLHLVQDSERPAAPTVRARRARWVAMAAGALVTCASAALGFWWFRPAAAPPPPAPEPPPVVVAAPAPPPVKAAEPAPIPKSPPKSSRVSKVPPLPDGFLKVTAQPEVVVLLDGARIGLTPLRVPARPGGHVLTLRQEATGLTFQKSIQLEPGQERREDWRPEKGRVDFRINPYGEVWLAGKFLGTTPFEPLALYEGKYLFEIRNSHLKSPVRREVTVKGGKDTLVKVDLDEAP